MTLGGQIVEQIIKIQIKKSINILVGGIRGLNSNYDRYDNDHDMPYIFAFLLSEYREKMF